MLLLNATTTKVQVVTGSASSVDVHASYVDNASGSFTTGEQNTAIATATTTDVVAAPGSGVVRNIKELVIRNKDAATSNACTVKHVTAGTTVELFKATLQPGEEMVLDSQGKWTCYDSTGAMKENATVGRLIKETILTAGTSFTTAAGTNTARLRMVGGGGGGGGCSSVASAASAAGGGGAGGYCEKVVGVAPNTAYTYAIGAAGVGNSGAAGSNGGDTTFTVGATTYTAKGGTGAVLATATAAVNAYAGGAGGVVGTNGDVNAPGQAGAGGVQFLVATPVVASGAGGSGPYGEGGVGITAVGAGVAGTGNGSGGGGAATGASTVRTGGSGTAGLIVVEEYS